ncbi:MAG: hypothetical protein PHC28_00525 [Flavobacterium sp.]|uniref:hypothetical protein n=1 Tax=Flavobacterium sp. TaxID=239 RepID=UPI002622011A|nr:hypothetical protein [Flavobacterium sp.]MDD5148951.1 hypothetical protein [Flavobacterium sp.]
MKLTTEQIDQLYTFTRQHYVEWYDLQSELVDHLANAIETQWQENPKLTFEEVLNKEFGKFGVFGFMDVVEEKQKFLGKKYNRLVFSHIATFFTLPKILLTITATWALFLVFKWSRFNGEFILFFYVLLLGFAFYAIIKNRMQRKQQIKENQKCWLFDEIMNQYGSFTGTIIFPLNFFLQIFNHGNRFLSNDYAIGFTSFFLVLMTLLLYVMFVLIPSKSKEYLMQTYPEYSV